MDDLQNLVENSKGGFKKLLEKLPGISGYEKKESRRETDRIVRETVAERFQEQWNRLEQIQRNMVKKGQIQYLTDMESAGIKIQTFIDKVKHASYGYSGLMDAVKVDDNALQQLYTFDNALLDNAAKISTALDDVEKTMETNEGVESAITSLEKVAESSLTTLNRRSEVITGKINS